MKSVKTEQFNIPLAESQEEYNTLFINVNRKDPLVPFTACFELSADEIAEINKTGKIYYQQCLMAKSDGLGGLLVDGDGNYIPSNLFHPMSIHVENPLNFRKSTIHHVKTKIETLLTLDESDLIEMFPNFEGNIKEHLQDRFDCGEIYVGSVGCEGFDPVTGCPGHEK